MRKNEHQRGRVRAIVALAVIAMAVALPGAALASGPTTSQYSDTAEQLGQFVQDDSGAGGADGGAGGPSGDPTATSDPGVGSLPLTGLDLGIVAIVASILIASGLALRRLSSADVRG